MQKVLPPLHDGGGGANGNVLLGVGMTPSMSSTQHSPASLFPTPSMTGTDSSGNVAWSGDVLSALKQGLGLVAGEDLVGVGSFGDDLVGSGLSRLVAGAPASGGSSPSDPASGGSSPSAATLRVRGLQDPSSKTLLPRFNRRPSTSLSDCQFVNPCGPEFSHRSRAQMRLQPFWGGVLGGTITPSLCGAPHKHVMYWKGTRGEGARLGRVHVYVIASVVNELGEGATTTSSVPPRTVPL